MTEAQNSGNNSSRALAKLLNQLNLPTLAMILVMGGGNIFATKQVSEQQRFEILQAVKQIHELHAAVDDFESRQKDALGKANIALDNQNQILRNQNMMIATQQQLINQLNKK